MRKILLWFGLVPALVLTSLFVLDKYAPDSHRENKATYLGSEKEDFKLAESHLTEGNPQKTLNIVSHYSRKIDPTTKSGQRWLNLLIAASEQTQDLSQLMLAYQFSPSNFDQNEAASLLAAEGFLLNGDLYDYKTIRNQWHNRETDKAPWMILDVDKLLTQGKRQDAIQLLSVNKFKGKNEVERLTRLALLQVEDNPKKAWYYLKTAESIDPKNTDIHLYRAKILETRGKNSKAAKEYQTAIQLEPRNIFLKDQFAEFYLRNGYHRQALKTWTENLAAPTLDTIWIKALFWSHVLTPANIRWDHLTPPPGPLQPLTRYLMELKEDQFWSPPLFTKVPNRNQYLQTQQATFWLRLLAAMQASKDEEARQLLKKNPFTNNSWSPDLQHALKQILTYKKMGTLLPADMLPPNNSLKPKHHFFQQLEEFADSPEDIPDELHELLLSKQAYVAALLAAGWNEAALNIQRPTGISEQLPPWVALEYTQALRENRGIIDAIQYAQMQEPTKELDVLTGEMMIIGGDSASAIDKLIPHAMENSDTGYRAAWLASLIYMDQGHFADARETIQQQPRLFTDLVGQETLARIAIQEGNHDLAEHIYHSIQDKSLEAKSYLAKKAFTDKNWDEARLITEKLLTEHPDNQQLRDNLEMIKKEQVSK